MKFKASIGHNAISEIPSQRISLCDLSRSFLMKEIQLTKGQVTFVDDEDFEYLNQFKWRSMNGRNTNYAVRFSYHFGNGKAECIMMHRLIMQAPKGLVVDHINHNGLDNCKENLRVVTVSINSHNRQNIIGAYKTNRPGNIKQRYRSHIKVNGKYMHLGTFDTFEEARKAYINAKLDYCKVNQKDIENNLNLFI